MGRTASHKALDRALDEALELFDPDEVGATGLATVLSSEFGYSAGAALRSGLSPRGSAAAAEVPMVTFLSGAESPQSESTVTIWELVGSLLRGGQVNEHTVCWLAEGSYEDQLLGDVIDCEEAAAADPSEEGELVGAARSRLSQFSRSTRQSFPTSQDEPLLPFEVAIEDDLVIGCELGIAWSSRTRASPPRVEFIVPGSLASRTPAIHVGMVCVTCNGVSLRGRPFKAMVDLIEAHRAAAAAATPLTLGFTHLAPAVSASDMRMLAIGTHMLGAYSALREHVTSTSVEEVALRRAARELRAEAARSGSGGQMQLCDYIDEPTVAPGMTLIARESYSPSFEGAIPVVKGDKVVAISTHHDEWWQVKIVSELTNNRPPEPGKSCNFVALYGHCIA